MFQSKPSALRASICFSESSNSTFFLGPLGSLSAAAEARADATFSWRAIFFGDGSSFAGVILYDPDPPPPPLEDTEDRLPLE